VDVGSRNIAVNFGSVPQSSFGAVGTTPAPRDFTISLQCQQSPGSLFVRLDATVAMGFAAVGATSVAMLYAQASAEL
jgi:type 1 fimbria pilin